ncbi:element excision factor XisH family protein [Scytonema sp. NUACC26]|uniref:element excision factor XisH family protein n=1 Tax=Scytonema sp. NUACC26 TaxID=3140176 RepID=UPI0034DCBCC8
MPAKDLFYKTVETALIQDGWIDIKSLKLDYDGTTLEIDLSADKLLSAQKGTIYIAAEVKSFVAPSVVYAFHQAIGQYIHYRMVLKHQRLDRTPYLAVPNTIYQQHFSNPFFQDSLKENQINLLIVNAITHEVDRWIPNPES